jgi:hypothetical protein
MTKLNRRLAKLFTFFLQLPWNFFSMSAVLQLTGDAVFRIDTAVIQTNDERANFREVFLSLDYE